MYFFPYEAQKYCFQKSGAMKRDQEVPFFIENCVLKSSSHQVKELYAI
jgi:hypothetical protein